MAHQLVAAIIVPAPSQGGHLGGIGPLRPPRHDAVPSARIDRTGGLSSQLVEPGGDRSVAPQVVHGFMAYGHAYPGQPERGQKRVLAGDDDATDKPAAQGARAKSSLAVLPRKRARACSSRFRLRASDSDRRIENHGSSLPQSTRPL